MQSFCLVAGLGRIARKRARQAEAPAPPEQAENFVWWRKRPDLLVLLAFSTLTLTASGWCADDRPRLSPVPTADQNATTGPAVGARIPAFEAVDQDGKPRTFDNLRGPNGLVLLFVRSADW